MTNKQPLTTNLLRLSADKKQLLVLITPVQDEVSVPSLTRLFHSSEHADFKLNNAGLNEAVQSFTRLETEKDRGAELESVAIADRVHAELVVNLGPLNMTAKAVITSAYGGLPVLIEQLKEELDTLGITEGIIEKNLSLLIEKSKGSKPGSIFQATIAKGKQPIHGKDATFKRLVQTPKERLLRPKKNEDGTVDMRNLGQLATVKSGSKLMQKIPYCEGQTGLTVTGDVVPHTSGKDFSFDIGENTAISEDDENMLVATLAGIPKALNNGMMVDDVLVINNVNVGYGNVDYEGSIIIEGDVCDGMNVKATGDISISGFVESAHLECGGDLLVGKGIIGHKVEDGGEHFSCEVSCEGSLVANFSQYSKINAGESVTVKAQLLHCDVTCNGDINVADDTGRKGTILGGTLRTSGGINAVSLGAHSGAFTRIDLIGHYPKLIASKKQINSTIHSEQEKLQALIEAQRKVDILPNSEKKQDLDARLMLTKEEVKKHLFKLKTALDDNQFNLQTYHENAKVVIQKEMFDDVCISIGKEKFTSTREYGPTKVSVKERKITAEPYKK